MDRISEKASSEYHYSKSCAMLKFVYQDILPVLDEINSRLDRLENRVRNIENTIIDNNTLPTITLIDGCRTFSITNFPKEMHTMFVKTDNNSYYCECKKDVFDDIIDLNCGKIKRLENLNDIVEIMSKSSVEEEFMVNLICNSQFEGYKLKVKILDKDIFAFDNLNISFLRGQKVGDNYIMNDDFYKYYDKITDAIKRKKSHCDIQIGKYILFFWY